MPLRFKSGKTDPHHPDTDPQRQHMETWLDEDRIRQWLAPPYKAIQTHFGRPPIDPVIGYKAHWLFCLKGDLISCNQLRQPVPKDTDYRPFCRCEGLTFTAGYLSLFRKHHLRGPRAEQLHQHILSGLQMTHSPPLRIGIWDSVPMPSYTPPCQATWHCHCQTPCNCPKHYSDPDAQMGWQRPTPPQTDKFVGYRKPTSFTYDANPNHRNPVVPTVDPADPADVKGIGQNLKPWSHPIDLLLVAPAIYDFERILDGYPRDPV